ncbi:MAG: ABC transporter substrate-binding protein [Chloroflexota bacterium]
MGANTRKKLLLSILLSLLLAVSAVSLNAQDDVIELDFVHIFSDDLRPVVIQGIIDEFQSQNPGIVINSYSTNADSDYNEVFLSALDSADLGDAPNIVQVEESLTQQAIDFGYFVPIDEVVTEEQMASLDDVLPTIREYYQIGDNFWSMPWNVSNPIMYYNRDMFVAAGLDPDQPPRTFDEILVACEAIMAGNPDLAACINWPLSAWYVEQWMAMQNELLLNNDNGRAARATETFYNSEPMIEIVRWWDELDANGYYSYTGRVGDDNGEGIAFLTQRTAMHLNSTAGLTLIQNFAEFDLGVAPLPLPFEEATNGVTVGGASLWVMADQTEEEMQAAVDFIFFLTQTDNDITWHKGTGYIPIRESSYQQLEADGYYEENPFFLIAVNQFREANANVATAGGVMGPAQLVRGHLLSTVQLLLDEELASDEELQEVMDNAKTRADEELQDYNRDFE